MSRQRSSSAAAPVPHGAEELSSVRVQSYNLEIRDEDGFIGDKANRAAFFAIVEELREKLRDADPLRGLSGPLTRKEIDALLSGDDVGQASLIHSAVEEFAQQLARVTRRFLRVKSWSEVKRIVIGGGFRQGRVGELAIGRANILLRSEGRAIELTPIRFDPDEAGLIGCAHLAPSWMFEAYDSILAVDIGGANIRAGIVRLNQKEASDLSKANVWKHDLWKHAEDDPARDEAIDRLGDMLADLVDAGKKKRKLAPFIGVGCPGVILDDGFIDRGAQNLPGNWHSQRFNLAGELKERIPEIGGHEVMVVIHNDAVAQGLSETPFMQDVDQWGALTIGTGLGNASFANRNPAAGKASKS